MSTATLPRRHVSALPRFVAVIAVLIVLLGVAALVHSRSTSSPAPAITTVGELREPHAHPGRLLGAPTVDAEQTHRIQEHLTAVQPVRPFAAPTVNADRLHRIQEHLSAAPGTTVPVPVNAGRRAIQD